MMKMVHSILLCFLFLTFTMVSTSRADSHDSIDPEELSISADERFGTSLAIISTHSDFIVFSALVVKLAEFIGLEEGWSSTNQFDFLVAVSAPNIEAGKELPVFLQDFRNVAVLEAIAQTDVASSNCNISSVDASTGEKVLLILSNHHPDSPNDSYVCLLDGLTVWISEYQGASDVNSIRRSFIQFLD